jgi:hypothetical protein
VYELDRTVSCAGYTPVYVCGFLYVHHTWFVSGCAVTLLSGCDEDNERMGCDGKSCTSFTTTTTPLFSICQSGEHT